MNPLSDAKILDAWRRNAAPWTLAVRDRQIESRRLVTDRAIIDAILDFTPETVLDLGCGEGWLARALCQAGIRVTGVDAVPELVAQARNGGGGEFLTLAYEELGEGELALQVDLAVCNFALLGNESVSTLFAAIPSLLNPGGAFIVQTLHPVTACGDLPYRDGWRQGSWDGFDQAFSDPAPWYFRTLESWIDLFALHRLRLLETREPLHPRTRQPASVIFIAQPT
ncbi:MAG TPA: class I SAM-dependent methyltransferase [Gammaproteobacteria bacterium]|nr:class I SAM-dependent methyltransferase [Gammaproteobacteria bacterium]